MQNKEKGRRGEAIAAAFLAGRGCRIIARNFAAAGGEVDIIAQDGDTLAFIEVKSRTGPGFGAGREAVTPQKQRHILQAAQAYLQQTNAFERPCRCDVAEVDLRTGRVDYIQNAFTL